MLHVSSDVLLAEVKPAHLIVCSTLGPVQILMATNFLDSDFLCQKGQITVIVDSQLRCTTLMDMSGKGDSASQCDGGSKLITPFLDL